MAIADYLQRQEVITDDVNPGIDKRARDLDEENDLSECPDCQGELTQYFDWDTVKYRCENCGMLISNQAILMEES